MQREAILRAKRVGSCELKTGASRGGRPFSDFGQDVLETARRRGSKSRSESAGQKVTCSLPLSLSPTLKDLPALRTLGKSVGGGGRKRERGPSESSGSGPQPLHPRFLLLAPRRPPPTHPSALCSWDLEGRPRGRQMVKESWAVLFAVSLFVFLIIQVKSEYILVKK